LEVIISKRKNNTNLFNLCNYSVFIFSPYYSSFSYIRYRPLDLFIRKNNNWSNKDFLI